MAALLPSEPLLDVPGVAAPTADGKAPTVQPQGVGKGKQLRLTTGGGGKGVGKTLGPPTAQSKGKKVQEVPTKVVHTDKGPVAVPLAVDVRLSVRFAEDGVFYPARIVERRKKLQPEDEFDYEYYVHWTSFNRRMDNWVNLEDMDLETLEREDEDDKEGKKGQKRKFEEEHDEEHADFDPAQLREHEEFTKVKNIQQIELGRFDMDTWYFSPFPAEYNDCKKLYFCEFSLMFFKQRSQMLRHLKKSTLCHPPGDEIYRKGHVSMFEVDGRKEKIYCQNLCYLAKLFLDHKTLYYDVDLFLFYILCEVDSRGAHLVGYFSKEKCSDEGYNLACILTLPPYQRKGYGKFLISMSYELSKIEGKVGTPERPLSDLGLVSYRGYWTRVILGILKDRQGGISIQELSDMTCIKPDDIISTLQHLNLIQYQKGQHVIFAAPHIIEMHLRNAGSAGLVVDSSSITWSPYNAERDYASVRT